MEFKTTADFFAHMKANPSRDVSAVVMASADGFRGEMHYNLRPLVGRRVRLVVDYLSGVALISPALTLTERDLDRLNSHGSETADGADQQRAENKKPRREAPAAPAWAEAVHCDRYGHYADLMIAGVSQRMRWIEPGKFLMGSPETEAGRFGDERQHQVTLAKGFWLADTACTQELWAAVMGGNPSQFRDDQNPVDSASWGDAQGFIRAAAGTGLSLRLPTEAEWEYACRAGTTTPFSFGKVLTPDKANYDGNFPYADNEEGGYRQKTIPVKGLPCNDWGLYQMHGNVWEWCCDWWGAEYPAQAVVDPVGPVDGVGRVMRGGGWYDCGGLCRSAARTWGVYASREHSGLRLVCDSEE